MSDSVRRYYRVALLADPRWGEGSLSWRAKCAFEAQGHTVFFFSPKTHAFAFTEGDSPVCAWRVRPASFRRFFANQKPDIVLLTDGVVADVGELRALAERAVVGCLCETAGQVRAMTDAPNSVHKPDFLWLAGASACEAGCGCGDVGCVRRLEALADREFARTPLANTIAYEPGVLCVQDATKPRIACLRALAQRDGANVMPVRCFGQGWPREWTCGVRCSEFVYAAKSSRAVVVFSESADDAQVETVRGEGRGERAFDAPVALACSAGARLVTIDEGATDAEGAQKLDPLAVQSLDSCPSSTPKRFLDDDIAEGLAELRGAFGASGKMPGSTTPRKIACILGYVGMGNFGDEYILATLDKRLRASVEGLSVVAISENPQHTFERRGIFALTLKQQRAVDEALSYACVAMVVAGLLFDQGIRWTMGKAELLGSLRYSTIPGIAGYVTLAHMNDAKPVLYGIGAGPLEVEGSRKLVELMGKMDAVFLARDEETARLIQSCNVAPEQAVRKADTAFLGFDEPQAFVDGWMVREFGAPSPEACGVELVAVSLREYENLPADFAERVACSLDAIARRYPRVHYALCALDPDDRRLASRIVGLMGEDTRAHLFDSGDDIESICDVLSRCHAGFSMRYHCSLILNRCGKPCVGMDYLPKVTSLYVEMGCEDLLLGTTASSDDIEAKLDVLLRDYDRWVDVVERGTRDLRELSAQAESLLFEWIEQHAQGKSFAVSKTFYLNDRPECELQLGQALSESQALRERADGLEHALRKQQDDHDAEVRALRDELDAVRSSHSFRAGLALTALPRALRRMTRR